MRLPTLLAAAGLLTVAALGHSQPPPAPTPVGLPPAPGPATIPLQLDPNATTLPAVPSPAPVATPPKPPEQTVDQLIAELERLKTQKAQIEKQEQAVKDSLTKKLGEQNERLKKLGVGVKEEPVPLVPRTAKLKTSSDEEPAPVGGKEDANPTTLPTGVRELQLDSTQCKRTKVGPSVSVCTSEQQAEAELGEEEGKAVWEQVDPKTESLVVVGYNDTGVMPKYDQFEVREVKAAAGSTYRFKYGTGDRDGKQRFAHLIGVEWPSRCKVYAVPKGAAVALD